MTKAVLPFRIPIRWSGPLMTVTLLVVLAKPLVAQPVATNACAAIASAQYTVNGSCVTQTFDKPGAFTASMDPGTCNGSLNDDAWGWFTATSAFTTVQYQGNQDAILHLFTGTCAALEPVACADAFAGTAAESVTLPTVIGQNYFIRVQRFNSSLAMTGNLCVFSSNPSSACGTTVYDTGGPSANYTSNQRYLVTYCPPEPGQMVNIDFTTFALEGPDIFGNPYDFMVIFDGPGTSNPIWAGFGNTGPGQLSPTHPSGCLTILFYSDGSDTFAGWAANVTCIDQPDCYYVLTLTDAFGDGWGSSSVGVSINGGAFQNYTLNGSSRQILIPVTTGSSIVFNYNATGPDQIENEWNVAILGEGGLFLSGSPPTAGNQFVHTADCIPEASAQEDCQGGFTICSDQQFNNNTTSTGFVQDLNSSSRGCLANNEQQGTWYFFSPATSGTVAFTIDPSANIDYDFAIWGPLTAPSCPPSGVPVRCSYASGANTFILTGSYNTGLRPSSGQTSEGQFGDGWVEPLTVIANQVYMLYIDNFDVTGQSFTLDWNLSNGATLDCTVLPVDLLELTATPKQAAVDLVWSTASEHNSARYVVERRTGEEAFAPIGSLPARGQSATRTDYRFTDTAPALGVNQYRILEVDQNGESKRSEVVVALFGTGTAMVVPNPADENASITLAHELPPNTLLRITDARGRTVHEQRVSNRGTSVPLSTRGLLSGLYTVTLIDEQGAMLVNTRFAKE